MQKKLCVFLVFRSDSHGAGYSGSPVILIQGSYFIGMFEKLCLKTSDYGTPVWPKGVHRPQRRRTGLGTAAVAPGGMYATVEAHGVRDCRCGLHRDNKCYRTQWLKEAIAVSFPED